MRRTLIRCARAAWLAALLFCAARAAAAGEPGGAAAVDAPVADAERRTATSPAPGRSRQDADGIARAAVELAAAVAAVEFKAAPNEEADVDRDGKVTLADLARLANDLATLSAPWRGDVNDDLYVNADDLLALAERLLAAAGRPTGEADLRLLVNGALLLDPPVSGEPVGSIETRLPGGAR